MLTNRLLVESTIKCRKCSAKTNWKIPFASQLIKTKKMYCRDLLRGCGSQRRTANKKKNPIKIEENIWKTVTKVNDKVIGTIYARQELLRCRRKSIFSLAASATLAPTHTLCLALMKICSNFKLTAWPGPTKTNTLKQKETLAKLLSPASLPSTSSPLPHTNTHVEQGKENKKKSFSSKVSISRFCWVKSLDTFAMYYFYYSQIPRSDSRYRLIYRNCVNERNF